MVRAVFQHKPASVYDDVPWAHYEFPRRYLSTVEATVGDLIIYYLPGKVPGRRDVMNYQAAARVEAVRSSPNVHDWYYAIIAPGSYLAFQRPVPRVMDRQVMESRFAQGPGRPASGGVNQSAVRALPEADFVRIVAAGLAEAGAAHAPGFAEAQIPFDGPAARGVIDSLLSRPLRNRAFRRQVLEAYDGTCAISGLSLRNGGGWMEVEAAHVRPVADDGPDDVRNGLALSSTLHKLFDRGLVTVADDMSILFSENKVPRDTRARLFDPSGQLRVPKYSHLRPHPDFLRYHRERVFGGGAAGRTRAERRGSALEIRTEMEHIAGHGTPAVSFAVVSPPRRRTGAAGAARGAAGAGRHRRRSGRGAEPRITVHRCRSGGA